MTVPSAEELRAHRIERAIWGVMTGLTLLALAMAGCHLIIYGVQFDYFAGYHYQPDGQFYEDRAEFRSRNLGLYLSLLIVAFTLHVHSSYRFGKEDRTFWSKHLRPGKRLEVRKRTVG